MRKVRPGDHRNEHGELIVKGLSPETVAPRFGKGHGQASGGEGRHQAKRVFRWRRIAQGEHPALGGRPGKGNEGIAVFDTQGDRLGVEEHALIPSLDHL